MWKKYFALDAAVWMLSGISMVSRASETVSGGQEIKTQEMANETLQTGQTGTYMPYEGAKYSLSFTVNDNEYDRVTNRLEGGITVC